MYVVEIFGQLFSKFIMNCDKKRIAGLRLGGFFHELIWSPSLASN
jgi:hypothetical protein